MFVIPDAFKENNEDYITIPVLKEFIKSKKIKILLNNDRKALMNAVIEYANTNDVAAEEVADWVDCVVKEGIKDIYIKTIDEKHCEKINYNWQEVQEKTNPLLRWTDVHHLCGNRYNDQLKLVKVKLCTNGKTEYYSFSFGRMVYIYDGKESLKARLYPAFVDLYPQNGIIIGRIKPKQNMYIYNNGNFDKDNTVQVESETVVINAMEIVENLFKIVTKGTLDVKDDYKEKLYCLLEKYTETPPEIVALIEENKSNINNVIETIAKKICGLHYTEDLTQDIYNLIEKYFSITYPNKEIFTTGRTAYPLRIAATDEEESKVDQRSAKEDPLQSKAVFFDNKKMIQKSKKCDGIIFMFEQISKSGKYYKVRFVVKKDYCLMKFTEYTEEWDIQNVLLLFINAQRHFNRRTV